MSKQIAIAAHLCAGLNATAQQIHANNNEKGFFSADRNIGESLMLIVSEAGEAMTAHQKDRFADWDNYSGIDAKEGYNPETFDATSFKHNVKDSFEDELADVIIRALDLAAGLKIDIEKHINAKVQYNKTREYLHGKRY